MPELNLLSLLTSASQPSSIIAALDAEGLIQKNHPELFALKNVPQDPNHHPEGDVWTHTLMAIDAAADIVRREKNLDAATLLLAVLCHDFGKPATTAKDSTGRIRSLGHSEAGVKPARAFLKRLGVDDSVMMKIEKLIREHLSPVILYRTKDEISDGAIVRLLKRLEPATIQELLAVSEADLKGRGGEWKGYPAREWMLGRVARLT